MNFDIVKMADADWLAVRRIYLEGLATGNASFETNAPEWDAWNGSHLVHSRLVARSNADVIGWAALSRVSVREVYRGVAEVSVYVGENGRGQGVGRALLSALVESSEANGIWTLQASIFQENSASLKLHLDHGFREMGYRERIAMHQGVWRDTVLLERRSSKVGRE
ncbi:MAG: GNAT family N-acetyltransferase [Pyrinomonadaceae bacterium]